MAANGGHKGAKKESEFNNNGNLLDSCAQGLLNFNVLLSSSKAIYARNGFNMGVNILDKLCFF